MNRSRCGATLKAARRIHPPSHSVTDQSTEKEAAAADVQFEISGQAFSGANLQPEALLVHGKWIRLLHCTSTADRQAGRQSSCHAEVQLYNR